jgi:excisionase family DNA binding protein
MDGSARKHDDRHATLPGDRPPRLLLTVEEAVERIGICRAYMFKLIREGDVRSVKVGRLRRVTPAALEDFVEQLSGGSKEPT